MAIYSIAAARLRGNRLGERTDLKVQEVRAMARFWQQFGAVDLNERQRKAVTRLLEAGPGGFEGGLTNQKYRGMTSASKITATRDLPGLADQGVLVQRGEGGATRYELDWARAAH